MKSLKLFALCALTAAVVVSCKKSDDEPIVTPVNPDPVVPVDSAEMPSFDVEEGYGIVVLKVFADSEEAPFYCNGVGVRGENVAGGDWSKTFSFEAVDGFDNWWVVKIPLMDGGIESEGEVVAFGGHPCLLNADGVADWNYEWTKDDKIVVLENADEAKVHLTNGNINFFESAVIYIEVLEGGWKATPCVEPDYYSINVTVNTPALATDETVYLVGDFNGWDPALNPMQPNADRTVWTLTVEATLNSAMKATLGSWDYDQMTKTEEGCYVGAPNVTIDDLKVEFTVEEFKNHLTEDQICKNEDEE